MILNIVGVCLFDVMMMQIKVDTNWYLEQNPDVAAAGMDPRFHYEHYGAGEGRLPFALHSAGLKTALWSGFSNLALGDLVANSGFTAGNFRKKDATFVVTNIVDPALFKLHNPVDPRCIHVAMISSNQPKKVEGSVRGQGKHCHV